MTTGLSQQRQVYMITYSRADQNIVSSRENFANLVVEAWSIVSDCNVLQWVVGKELHCSSDKDEGNAWHYHMALKLDKKCRWLQVRNILRNRYNLKVHFSDNHSDYYTAYKYVTKEDINPAHSENHPDLKDSEPPKTSEASKKRHQSKVNTVSKKKTRKDRLSVFEVVQIIRDKSIHSRVELLALAEGQRREGKTNLAEFIANRGCKVVNEALSLAKEFDDAEATVLRSSKTRIQILQEQLSEKCVSGCGKAWLSAAEELLCKNSIDTQYFCNEIYNALNLGRGKYRNIYIYGPSNCGKTFILSPLKVIYNAFVNPASGTFAWVGAENAEIIILNDFRWSPSIIAWADFLQMLEGDSMHLATPKNFSNKDVIFDKDTPFFATADAPIVLIKGGCIDRSNTEMMSVRWRTFQFFYQVKEEERKDLKPCGRCFAEFILTHNTIHNTLG